MPDYFSQGSFNPEQSKGDYDVDIVLCIDGTKSMAPVIEMTKQNALNLSTDIMNEASKHNKHITNLRMRIIVFRDYLSDGEYAMQMTDFYSFPEDKNEMHELVSSIIASGGGDEPEDALEALAYAMNSEWQPSRPNAKRRQVIALWTDTSAHEIGFGKKSDFYDMDNLPSSFGELTEWWGDDRSAASKMHYESKRLVLFAPKEKKPWSLLDKSWDHVILYPSVAGKGMKEQDYHKIIEMLVKTI